MRNKARIDLSLLEKLEEEARQLMDGVEATAYNWEHESDLKPDKFIWRSKAYYQAKNLVRTLKEVKTACLLYVKTEPDSTISFNGEEVNPFVPLQFLFGNEGPASLPATISQYAELFGMRQVHSQAKTQFRENVGLQDEDMDIEVIEQDIAHIELDYALDGYNHFYLTCLLLIAEHQPSNDFRTCAAEILKLFKD